MSQELLCAELPTAVGPEVCTSSPSIFLHGLWRSGTTFLWSRFRANPHTCCYYEPLHEGLHRLTRERIGRADAKVVASNRHPELAQPYFAEFEPLISGRRGVAGSAKHFAYERIALAADQSHPALEKYIRMLVDHPAAGARSVVLGFNRSSFRMGWLRQRFAAHHVHVERDPAEIWTSYLRQFRDGNGFFLRAWLNIVERNADHPLFAGIAARLPLRRTWRDRLAKPSSFYTQALATMPLQTSYLLVFHVWRLSLLHALSSCDQVFDYSRANERNYPETFCAALFDATGVPIDLEGLRPNATETLSVWDQRKVERDALGLVSQDALTAFVDKARVARQLHQVAPAKAALVEQIL